MRLSDAIALGRTLIGSVKGCLFEKHGDGNLFGCALGMGVAAVGRQEQAMERGQDCSHEEPLSIWPWLEISDLVPKCGCSKKMLSYRVNGFASIVHMFDHHVGVDMTMEQLIDYVRSVEPNEFTPEETVPEFADEYEHVS